MKKTTLWRILGFAILVAGLFAWSNVAAKHKSSSLTNREVALTCTTDMATQFHVHPTLKIIANGREQTISANLGIQPTCMTSLHTHDTTGVIHVEAPEKRDFTLADFFAVWKQPFSKDEVLSYKVDATHKIRVSVNGAEVSTYENTILRDKDQILITYENK